MNSGNQSMVTTVTVVTVTVLILGYFLFRSEPPKMNEDVPEIPSEGGLGMTKDAPYLPPGKSMFQPTLDWQPVGDHQVCPPGLEYKLNVYEGTKYARIAQ